MKKLTLIILFVFGIITLKAQLAKTYTEMINFADTYITGGLPAKIQGNNHNTMLHYLVDNKNIAYHETTRPFYEDSSVTIYSGGLWICNTDVTGAWDNSKWDLLISFDAYNNLLAGDDAGVSLLSTGTNNTLLGHTAGTSITSGDDNVCVGDGAGYTNITGAANTFVGTEAGYDCTARFVTALGYRSFFDMTEDSQTAIGAYAGYQLTTGTGNCFLGYHSGYTLTTEDNNTCLGNSSYRNGTGDNNTIIGYKAGFAGAGADNNVIIGSEAGMAMTTADDNVFVGKEAGEAVTLADGNTFVGNIAGNSTTTGGSNVFIGSGTGEDNTIQTDNTFVGYVAGGLSNSSSYNTYIGSYAGLANSGVGNNCALGYKSLGSVANNGENVTIGAWTGYNNIGGDNIFIGDSAGYHSIGSDSLIIDNNADQSHFISGDMSDDSLTFNCDVLINKGALNYGEDAEANDTYVITARGITTYTKGMQVWFEANTANTGACTININGLGAKSLKSLHDQDPADNYIEAGSMVALMYDGTNFQILSPDANP